MAAMLTSMDCVASSAQEWPASPAGLGISADLGRVSLNNALHGSNGNRTPIGTLTRLIAPLLANNNRTWPCNTCSLHQQQGMDTIKWYFLAKTTWNK